MDERGQEGCTAAFYDGTEGIRGCLSLVPVLMAKTRTASAGRGDFANDGSAELDEDAGPRATQTILIAILLAHQLANGRQKCWVAAAMYPLLPRLASQTVHQGLDGLHGASSSSGFIAPWKLGEFLHVLRLEVLVVLLGNAHQALERSMANVATVHAGHVHGRLAYNLHNLIPSDLCPMFCGQTAATCRGRPSQPSEGHCWFFAMDSTTAVSVPFTVF